MSPLSTIRNSSILVLYQPLLGLEVWIVLLIRLLYLY